MLSRSIARSLMGIVPDRLAASITLLPDSPSPINVNVFNVWLKPMTVSLSTYGELNLQGDETIVKVPDHELNPAFEGREIRARDQILIGTTTYRVLSARLKTVRTLWECTCRKEMI
jgi:hypothetical protein